jgi:antitoxin component of MazEF toxin-antitoxin module
MASGGFGTDGQLAIKTDVAVDFIGDKLGVPASVRNTQAERAVLMEEMQAQQATMAVAQAQAMQAGAMPPDAMAQGAM